MRVCFCPNMAVVAAENPLSGEAWVIREQHHCGKDGLLYTLVNKPMNLSRRRKSLGPSGACSFCRWNWWRSCSRTTFHTRRRSTPTASTTARLLVEGFFSNWYRTSSSNASCEIIVLALCCAYSLHMYQFLVGDGRQKPTYDIWTHTVRKTLVTNPLRFADLPYAETHAKWMSASSAQVKRSMRT